MTSSTPVGCSGTCDLRPACRYHSHMSVTATPAKSELPVVPTPEANGHATAHGPHIDYELILDCVHCGLCTASCPTYVETGERGRLAARPHLPHAASHRRHARARRRREAPPRPVPELPGVRDGLPLRRAVRQADRAVPRLHGRDRTGPAGAIAQRHPALHAVPHLPVPLAQPRRARPGPAHAMDRPRLACRTRSASLGSCRSRCAR